MTLATVNSNVGAFANASVTVNAKGLVTAASTPTGTVNKFTYLRSDGVYQQPTFDAAATAFYFEDFINGVTSMSFAAATGGSNNQTGNVTTARNPGIMRLRTTTVNGSVAGFAGFNMILFGAGTWTFETVVKMVALVDVTDKFTFRTGFGDSTTTADNVDGAYFEYDSAVSANWGIVTSAASGRTRTASSVAVNTDWVRLTIVVNAAATSVEYFINGTSVGTKVASIPTGANYVAINSVMGKTLGNGTKDIYLDYIMAKCEFTAGTRET